MFDLELVGAISAGLRFPWDIINIVLMTSPHTHIISNGGWNDLYD